MTGVVLPLPPVPTITQNLNTLTSSSPTGNQWYLNGVLIPGATGQNYTITLNGTYTVVVTDANGCSSTSDPLVVGMEEFESSGIIMYPNPVSEKLYIDFPPAFAGNASLQITNAVGASVYEKKETGHVWHVEIDLKDFAGGVYMLGIQSGDHNYKKVFLKL